MNKPRDNQAFLRMRKGIFEHVRKGWMDSSMFLAYSVLLETCDWATGVWHGSGAKLRDLTGSQWSERTAERVLEQLAEGKYIESKYQRGKRGNYDILINNYIPTSGEAKGKKLRPVTAGFPLSDDNSGDTVDVSATGSAAKTVAMAVGTSGKVTTKLPTELPTKVPTQVASIQEVLQEPLPSVAQEVSRENECMNEWQTPRRGVFEKEEAE
jgi:hypothetical protein